MKSLLLPSKAAIISLTASAAFLFTPIMALAQQDPADAVLTPPVAAVPAPLLSEISLSKGLGKIIKLPHPVASIFAADPNVVEVHPASPTSIFVFGKDIGATSIVATDANGNTVAQFSVNVAPSNFINSRLGSVSQTVAPGSMVSAENELNGVIVRGTVNTPDEAQAIMNQAKIISPSSNVINNLEVAEPVQVELKVRIAYMSRSITRQLGIDWGTIGSNALAIGKFAVAGSTMTAAPSLSGSAPGAVGLTFPGGTLEGVIDALASDNLAHLVAEPTLTTLSGTQANFIVGGQFPIPVAENNGVITVDFKTYGVQLTFTPTVFSDGRIALQVSPQISAISNANAVTINSIGTTSTIIVPGLTTEGASSTVILGSGQGMAIAGMLQDTTSQTDNAVPGLGEVPVLGALFRGDSLLRQQTELVITVTPYLINPVNAPGALAYPDDGWTPANDLQRILLLRNNGTDAAAATIPGDAGFIVQ